MLHSFQGQSLMERSYSPLSSRWNFYHTLEEIDGKHVAACLMSKERWFILLQQGFPLYCSFSFVGSQLQVHVCGCGKKQFQY